MLESDVNDAMNNKYLYKDIGSFILVSIIVSHELTRWKRQNCNSCLDVRGLM